ncbi:MAG: c-type cytochrome [Desulfobacterales bacterium]|nr:c-type cytochrome [Desulfobacterales bacterium]
MLAGTLFLVATGEKARRDHWRGYQKSYKQIYTQRLADRLSHARETGPKEDIEAFTRMLDEVNASSEKIDVVFLPDANVSDFCITCHRAMGNPLFQEGQPPLKSHPAGILKYHPISSFGCTLCHHGQGVGLTEQKAHGFEENWESPRLPLKYIQSSCFECHENVVGLQGAQKAAMGKTLFVEKGCYGCHDARTSYNLPKFSTPFNGLSRKISSKAWLLKWIQEPAKIRPATLMPKFRLADEQLNDLVAYLYAIEDNQMKLSLADERKGSAEKGKTAFNQKGCVACHSEKPDVVGLTRRVPLLSEAGIKFKGDWLVNWISNPAAINPDTWMPRLELTDEEIQNLTSYLRTLGDPEMKKYVSGIVPEGNQENGARLAQSMGCLGCHQIRGNAEPAKVGISVAEVADKRMEELPFGSSKVPHTKWDWIENKITNPAIYKAENMPMSMPDFNLSPEEVEQLTVFYLFNRLLKLPEKYLVKSSDPSALTERGQWMLSHFNCRGCHMLISGETPRIDGFLLKKSLVPPRIVDEAEKVQPAWLYNYLNRPSAMRPWLSIRMPTFNMGYEDRSMLIRYMYSLMADEKQKVVTVPYETALVKSDYAQEALDMGEYRFRSDKCMQCHPVSFTGELPEGKKEEDLSINLMTVKSRLRFAWIKNFLRNPDQYAGAGTKMPFVYYTPDKAPRIPDPEDWIERTALFMMFMEKVPEPMKTEETTREVQTFDFNKY